MLFTYFRKQDVHCATSPFFLSPFCTFCAGRTVICASDSSCQDAALQWSGRLSLKHRAALAKQWKKGTKTCRLSLPVAPFHPLPEISTVHQAAFGPGPHPWFPRFAWLSRRQHAPSTAQNQSATNSLVRQQSTSPSSTHSSYPCCLPPTPQPLCPWELSNYRLLPLPPPPHPCSLFHYHSMCLHERHSFSNSAVITVIHVYDSRR